MQTITMYRCRTLAGTSQVEVFEAADGIRTHDLLHGKQLRPPTQTEPNHPKPLRKATHPAQPSRSVGLGLSPRVSQMYLEVARVGGDPLILIGRIVKTLEAEVARQLADDRKAA